MLPIAYQLLFQSRLAWLHWSHLYDLQHSFTGSKCEESLLIFDLAPSMTAIQAYSTRRELCQVYCVLAWLWLVQNLMDLLTRIAEVVATIKLAFHLMVFFEFHSLYCRFTFFKDFELIQLCSFGKSQHRSFIGVKHTTVFDEYLQTYLMGQHCLSNWNLRDFRTYQICSWILELVGELLLKVLSNILCMGLYFRSLVEAAVTTFNNSCLSWDIAFQVT